MSVWDEWWEPPSEEEEAADRLHELQEAEWESGGYDLGGEA